MTLKKAREFEFSKKKDFSTTDWVGHYYIRGWYTILKFVKLSIKLCSIYMSGLIYFPPAPPTTLDADSVVVYMFLLIRKGTRCAHSLAALRSIFPYLHQLQIQSAVYIFTWAGLR